MLVKMKAPLMSNPTAPMSPKTASAELRDRVVIVTGGGSGLGEASAHAFVQRGAKVAVLDINGDAAARVKDALGVCDKGSMAIACDVSDAGQVGSAIDQVVAHFGRLDVVVNNAAVDYTVSIERMTLEQWQRAIGVNLCGPFLFAKLSLPHLAKTQGHIVNVSSIAATRAWANASAYHASKWGLLGFSRALSVEARDHGVRVTTILPGGMRTHFFDRFVEQGIPMPDEANLQDPANVAEVIVFSVMLPRNSALQEAIVTPMTETSWP
jgi:NAD(P)-dependent dehydrogenase (short-subunit alcohol dehydrogenase family)